jgi:hypothetical protein
MIRNAGAHLMFLPPYSPDLNPIEQAFAKIKHLMRRAMERTVEAAQDRLVSVLDTIPPNECANYFSGAGYAARGLDKALASHETKATRAHLAVPHKTSFPPSLRGSSLTRHTFSPEIFQESRFKT